MGRIKLLIYVALWFVLIYFLSKTLKTFPDIDTWRENIGERQIRGLLGYSVCFLLAYIIRTWRFGYLVRLTTDISWKKIAIDFPWLFLIGALTPLRAGESYRAIWIQKHNGSSGEVLGYWFAERFTDLIIVLTILLTGLSYLTETVSGSLRYLCSSLLLAMFTSYLLVWFFQKQILFRLQSFPVPKLITDFILAFDYMNRQRIHCYVVLSSLAIWGFIVLGFWFGFKGFYETSTTIPFVFVVATLTNITALISVAPGNIGGFQAATVLAATWFVIDKDTAFISSVFLQSTGLSISIFIGISSLAIKYIFGSSINK